MLRSTDPSELACVVRNESQPRHRACAAIKSRLPRSSPLQFESSTYLRIMQGCLLGKIEDFDVAQEFIECGPVLTLPGETSTPNINSDLVITEMQTSEISFFGDAPGPEHRSVS